MKLLILRTDNPDAEIGLYDSHEKLVHEKWRAHRQLAETLHTKLQSILIMTKIEMSQIDGIVIFAGPGSFTGLRIGFSVANTLAYSLNVPIVASNGDDWLEIGISLLLAGKGQTTALPEYGMPAHITESKK